MEQLQMKKMIAAVFCLCFSLSALAADVFMPSGVMAIAGGALNEILAFLFLFSSAILYNLTRKREPPPPCYTFGEIDMEAFCQQIELEKMWVRHILYSQQALIIVTAAYTLIDSLIFN